MSKIKGKMNPKQLAMKEKCSIHERKWGFLNESGHILSASNIKIPFIKPTFKNFVKLPVWIMSKCDILGP